MPELEIYLESRDKSVDRRMYQYEGLEVEAELSDSRTCRFTAPIEDINSLGQSNVQHLIPHARLVKVLYLGRPVFWGPIIKPIFNFKEGKVEVNCHDPSIYWKNHHIDTVEAGDADEVKVNGAGFQDLAFMADATAAEIADGAVDPGVTSSGDVEDYLLPGEPPRLTMKFRNGDNIYDCMQQLQERPDGPDWELVPVDEDHPLSSSAAPGYYVMPRFVESLGEDKSDEVIFHYGFGRTNLDNLIYEPDGAAVRNRYIVANGRGSYRVAKYLPGYDQGIMEGREEASGRAPRPAAMRLRAEHMVERYGKPLPAFTVIPTWDQGLMGSAASTPWRFPTGYSVGDLIRCQGKKGRMYIDFIGRVMKVKLAQQNAAENVRTEIEVIPHLDALDITSGSEIQ